MGVNCAWQSTFCISQPHQNKLCDWGTPKTDAANHELRNMILLLGVTCHSCSSDLKESRVRPRNWLPRLQQKILLPFRHSLFPGDHPPDIFPRTQNNDSYSQHAWIRNRGKQRACVLSVETFRFSVWDTRDCAWFSFFGSFFRQHTGPL